MQQAVSIVAIKGRITYLGRRLNPADNFGKRGCPGGKVEPGETQLEGALRELRQETGLHALEMLSLGTLYLSNPDFGTYECHGFAVRVPPGTELANLEPPKNKGWSPIPIGSVLKMPDHSLLPGTKQFVRAAASRLGIIKT